MVIPGQPALRCGEDAYTKAVDRCWANCVIKAGTGLAIGTLISVAFMKKRLYPMHIGFGTGIGFAISDFNKEVKEIK